MLVGVCWKSGQRSDLHATIEEGNCNGNSCDKNRIPVAAVPVQQLLRDCETRWSSTFNMTGRVIALYPVITSLFCMASKLILFLAGYYYFCSNTTPCRTRPPCICGSQACGAERHSPATWGPACCTAAPFIESDTKPLSCPPSFRSANRVLEANPSTHTRTGTLC